MEKAYIISSFRSAGTKRARGFFKDTRADELLAQVLKKSVENTKGIKASDIEDMIIGCAFPEGMQGLNIGKVANQLAGFPETVTGATINRYCSSGLEAIAGIANKIKVKDIEIGLGGGVESMTVVPMGGNIPRPHPEKASSNPEIYVAMGVTAENVSKRYNVSRQSQDEFAYLSHKKAAEATKKGLFKEILPIDATKYTLQENKMYKKETFPVSYDDGIREETTIEGLSALRPVFSIKGTVTAGNSSQMTDGAAATILMSESKCKSMNITPIAEFVDYTVAGCKADEMGIGPAIAIPKLLKRNKLEVKDIDIFELNEAFASQAVYCQRELKIDIEKLNVYGGAIALGHPLGCTGAKLLATLISILKERKKEFGIVSMCIGGGMGAAGLIKMV